MSERNMHCIYLVQSIQISANTCDFDKPTITRRKNFVLSSNLQKYSNFFWDAHIRHIPPSEVFPHLRHISSLVVPWRLNWMKPVELEGQKQGKTKLLWPFQFIFVQKWKKLSFSWHIDFSLNLPVFRWISSTNREKTVFWKVKYPKTNFFLTLERHFSTRPLFRRI